MFDIFSSDMTHMIYWSEQLISKSINWLIIADLLFQLFPDFWKSYIIYFTSEFTNCIVRTQRIPVLNFYSKGSLATGEEYIIQGHINIETYKLYVSEPAC